MIQQVMTGKIKLAKVENENTYYTFQGTEWVPNILPETETEIPITENMSFLKYNNEEFAIAKFSVILYDKVDKIWTIAYNQGPIGVDVREVSVFVWIGEQWKQCVIKNSTHLLLHPQQSSLGVVLEGVEEDLKNLLFLIRFANHELVVEWNRPDLKDTRFLYNEVFAPLAATTGISVMSSILFPKFIVDPKRAIGWAIPGWLMLDGLNVFNKVMNGAYTPRTVPLLKDKTFWIKAVASSIGPVIGSAMVKKSLQQQ
jgi:hypothetical protein